MNETKRDRFIRVMTNRVTKILEAVDQLSKCADHRSYDYTPDMVDRAFQQIVDQLGQVRSIFDTEKGRKTFSLRKELAEHRHVEGDRVTSCNMYLHVNSALGFTRAKNTK